MDLLDHADALSVDFLDLRLLAAEVDVDLLRRRVLVALFALDLPH